ncbi:YncE family protein [Maribellus mangrovi]|uniref:YncE family protein n=1 Tax=Maribellus mangrovi TaxID=3133146 RepID=UPI0030ED7656
MKTLTFKFTILVIVVLQLMFTYSCQDNQEEILPEIVPKMIFCDNAGVWRVDEKGNKRLIDIENFEYRPLNVGVEVQNDTIYVHNNYIVSVIDLSGNHIRDISISPEVSYPLQFCILPDGRFAFLDNKNDKVSFTTATGEFILDVPMENPSPENLQNVNGVVVDSFLIVANTGYGTVLSINLNSYQSSIHLLQALGDIDFCNGIFYHCDGRFIYRAKPDAYENELICTFMGYNAVGLAVDENGTYAYITMNFANKIYKVDLVNDSYLLFMDELNYPTDIEWVK